MTEQPEQDEAANGQSQLTEVLAMPRAGYCAFCAHNPPLPLPQVARNPESKCCGCWFTESKPNWQPMANS